MAPSILSNSSLLLADAIVERKSVDYETPLPRPKPKVNEMCEIFITNHF